MMSEESDRVSLSLCLSSRYAVTHSSPSSTSLSFGLVRVSDRRFTVLRSSPYTHDRREWGVDHGRHDQTERKNEEMSE